MANPMDVLAPNNMGTILENIGLDELVLNRGLGVAEVSQSPTMRARKMPTAPAAEKNRLRVAKAREFGMTKETVGF